MQLQKGTCEFSSIDEGKKVAGMGRERARSPPEIGTESATIHPRFPDTEAPGLGQPGLATNNFHFLRIKVI